MAMTRAQEKAKLGESQPAVIEKSPEFAGIRKVSKVRKAHKVLKVRKVRKVDTVHKVRRERRSLKITLQANYSKLPEYIKGQDYKILRQQRRIANFKGRYLPPPLRSYNNRYAFKFGHNPFQHRGFQGPSIEEQWEVYNLMKDDLKANFGKEVFLDKPDMSTNEAQSDPAHMGDDLTIHNIIKVILSIATENSLAIKQEALLRSIFTYDVDGQKVTGTIPNYHKMRVCSPEKLANALGHAGQQNIRQRAFHAILAEVYAENVKRLEPGVIADEYNPYGAADFVPGLLSLDYLKRDNLTKQERFDMLVKFDQIAVKTGCCLLAFNLKIPVFVVDTHAYQMVRNLGWIPDDCAEADKACMFLDTVMDESLKFGLHQAFWHHRINCARCAPRANPLSLKYQQRICPLEHLLDRNLQFQVKAQAQKSKVVQNKVVKQEASSHEVTKKSASALTFFKARYDVAEQKGYVLRKVEIDDNFGDGSRQNKDQTATYWWGRKEHAHKTDIIKLEDALEDMGMTMEAYEARFVKKVRVKKTTKVSRKVRGAANNVEEIDIKMEDDERHDDIPEYSSDSSMTELSESNDE